MLAKYTYAGANSYGCPGLPKGVFLPNSSNLSGEKLAGINGVQIGPGATPLTLMPCSAIDC